jgi:parallel beta-helix repeat protein
MKTLNTFFLSFAFLFLGLVPISAMGQSLPHTFTANTAAKASEVNENFTYLLERFGTRKTTVNCSGGESITTALQNYNHIVISGICTENLSLDATSLPHRLVILEGTSSSSDGISASDTSKAVVEIFNGGITLKATNLQFKNGTYGILAYRGPTVVLENVSVKDNTGTGIHIGGTTYGKIKDSTVKDNGGNGIYAGFSSMISISGNTISGHTSESSISIDTSSAAYIVKNTITNGKYSAISVNRSSSAIVGDAPDASGNSKGNTIQSADVGMKVKNSSHVKAQYNTVSLNNEYQIEVWGGASLSLVGGTVTGNSSNAAIKVKNSVIYLENVTVSGGEQGIQAENNSTVLLEGGNTISANSEHGVHLKNSTMQQYSDISVTTIKSNTDAEIYAKRSYLDLDNVTVTGSSGSDEIVLDYGSFLELGPGSSVTGTVECGNKTPDNGTFVNDSGTSVTTSGC